MTDSELCTAMIYHTAKYLIGIGEVHIMPNEERPYDMRPRGTGSLVSVDGRLFLLSAKHVLERGEDDNFFCLVYSTGFENPQIVELAEVIRHADLDLAIYRIQEEDMNPDNKSPLCINRFDTVGLDIAGDSIFVQGFPGDAAMPEQDGLTFVAQGYLTRQGQVTDYIIENDLLSIDYRSFGQYDLEGNVVQPYDPSGKSGSPVWKTNIVESDGVWNPEESSVVGLTTHYSACYHRLNAIRGPALVQFLCSLP